MEFKMEFLTLILCVTPAIVESITISSNGNSPKTKMLGGMMVDVQQGFVPMTPNLELTTESSNYEKSRKFNTNSTKLALNERYRRLIPYMTFYYANDIAIPTTESTRNIEVEKAQIIEAQELANQRQAKKIYSQRNIPRYQGNRLTQHNIASANPTKIFYKNGVPVFQIPFNKAQTLNYNHLYTDLPGFDYDGRLVQKFNNQSPAITTTKRPFLNLYNEESPNIRYYLSEKEHSPKYKLVPYDQTPPYAQAPINIPFERFPVKVPYEQATPVKIPYEQAPPVRVPVKVSYDQAPQIKVSYEQPAPVKVLHDQTPVKLTYENTPVKLQYEQKKPQNENVYATRKPVLLSVLVPKELYVKPRPVRPPTIYDSGITAAIRKQPVVVSENYYQKQRPQSVVAEPVIESGFKPIANPVSYTTVPSIQTAADIYGTPSTTPDYHHEISTVAPAISEPNYYQYVVDQSNPEPINPPTSVTLASLLNSLQINKSIPKPITKENVASSIRTLLQVLNTLKATKPPNVDLVPFQGTPKPFKALNAVKESPILAHLRPEIVDSELEKDLHLAPISNPSQHLDDDRPSDHSSGSGVTSTQYPLRVTSDDEGGTPGRPGADYPILSTIPHTSFDCKTQRYKGFFADTETRCQVWHYCDLNGGQASFLCPNGTIFSQAGLTCDWWFNVRCDSTAQLYVLNESLYKFILPHSPKFPEDYSGPLVDKYLTLKFKEMEEEFKKNKNKQSDNKSDSEEDNSSEASTEETRSSASAEMDKRQLGELSEASVIIESPGNSGKVQRLQDD